MYKTHLTVFLYYLHTNKEKYLIMRRTKDRFISYIMNNDDTYVSAYL